MADLVRGRVKALGLAFALALTCLGTLAAQAGALALPPGFREETVFDGLEEPTSLRFAPDGRVFVAEKSGRVLVFDDVDDDSPELFTDLSQLVYNRGDRGLLGMALDPAFGSGRPFVYLLYTYDHILGAVGPGEEAPRWGDPDNPLQDSCPETSAPGVDDCPVSGRLVKLTAVGNHAQIGGDGLPLQNVLVEDWCQQDSSHTIGDLQFDGAGALYASGGEGAGFNNADYGQYGWPSLNQCGDPPGPVGALLSPPTAEGGALRSQDLRTLGDPTGLDGSIIRIDPDTGLGLPGNPRFGIGPDANAERIIAYGFRNPFRFVVDAQNEEIYAGNVGWDDWEEIDRLPLVPGSLHNSGWPCYEGAGPNPVYQGLGLNICNGLYSEANSTSPPFFEYEHREEVFPDDDDCYDSAITGSAISGMDIYPDSGPFPDDYAGALFFADSVRGCIFVASAGDDGRPDASTVANFMSQGGLYPGVDVEIGPDGNLYYSLLLNDDEGLEGSIHRISYDPNAPFARIEANKTYGKLEPNLSIEFDGTKSSDPQAGPLTYAWDLDGDGAFDDSNAAKPSFVYTSAVNVEVALRVKDNENKTSVDKLVVYPGDTPPQPQIVAPTTASTWGVGQQIPFSAVALDAEEPGGAVPATELRWRTRILHCPGACHAHPYQGFTGVASGSLSAPDHDYPSAILFVVTATDARGLSATKTVQIEARGATMRVTSDPPGITLGAGARSEPGPFELTAIEGSQVTLSAPPSAEVGGQTLFFEGWSDGGARVHSVPAGSATYTARFGIPVGPPPPPPPPPELPKSKPTPKLTAHPAKLSRSARARFAFHVSVEDARFACRIDARPYGACRSPRVYRRLEPGRHVFRVLAVDEDGRAVSKVRRFAWRILAP